MSKPHECLACVFGVWTVLTLSLGAAAIAVAASFRTTKQNMRILAGVCIAACCIHLFLSISFLCAVARERLRNRTVRPLLQKERATEAEEEAEEAVVEDTEEDTEEAREQEDRCDKLARWCVKLTALAALVACSVGAFLLFVSPVCEWTTLAHTHIDLDLASQWFAAAPQRVGIAKCRNCTPAPDLSFARPSVFDDPLIAMSWQNGSLPDEVAQNNGRGLLLLPLFAIPEIQLALSFPDSPGCSERQQQPVLHAVFTGNCITFSVEVDGHRQGSCSSGFWNTAGPAEVPFDVVAPLSSLPATLRLTVKYDDSSDCQLGFHTAYLECS